MACPAAIQTPPATGKRPVDNYQSDIASAVFPASFYFPVVELESGAFTRLFVLAAYHMRRVQVGVPLRRLASDKHHRHSRRPWQTDTSYIKITLKKTHTLWRRICDSDRSGACGHRLRRYSCRLIADRGQIITFMSTIFYNFDIFT